jgi:hypothetical protein
MEPSDDQVPGHSEPSRTPAIGRSFTSLDLEAVIRRAVELQTGTSARAEEGISEEEVARIGQELGLEPAAVRRAMAEVHGRAPEERGRLGRAVGPRSVRASRVLQRPASSVGPELDRYFRETELMVVQRRFSDRTRYARNPSFAAGLARVTRSLSSTHQHVDLKQLDLHVSPLDSGSCLVEVSTDLGAVRAGLLGGIIGSTGGLAAGWSTVVWATPIADPLMLVGIPALAAAWLGTRVIYRTVSNTAEEKLETLLDRLEHGELP